MCLVVVGVKLRIAPCCLLFVKSLNRRRRNRYQPEGAFPDCRSSEYVVSVICQSLVIVF